MNDPAERIQCGPPLSPPRVHFEVRVLAEVLDRHEAAALAPEGQAFLGTAVRALAPSGRDECGQLLARGAAAQRPTKVDAARRVEAQVPQAVGRQPATIAAAAERVGGRGDDAEQRTVWQREAVGWRRRVLDDRLDGAVPSRERVQHLLP